MKDAEFEQCLEAILQGSTAAYSKLYDYLTRSLTGDAQARQAEHRKQTYAYFQPKANQNNPWAQAMLGFCYREGFGVPKNDNEAVKWYRLSAEQGNCLGQNGLGLMYKNGHGVPQDDSEAVTWYRLAAEQNLAQAQFNLGWMYDKGRGVAQDAAEAIKWYRLAAEQNWARAQTNLGLMYQSGRGVPQSDAEAVKWYRRAAEQNLAQAQFNLGWMYADGCGVPQSDVEAVKWYRRAAEQNDASAQINLGALYQNGRGVPQSDIEAVKWYRKVAEQNVAAAQNSLGVMYDEGRGVAQSDAEAVKWYRKAAEQNWAAAQNNLGVMYDKGQGVPQSDAEAVKWYRKAAEQNLARAQTNLGWMYREGRGVPKSIETAIEWYVRAEAQGQEDAKSNLAALSLEGYSKQIENARLTLQYEEEQAKIKKELETLKKVLEEEKERNRKQLLLQEAKFKEALQAEEKQKVAFEEQLVLQAAELGTLKKTLDEEKQQHVRKLAEQEAKWLQALKAEEGQKKALSEQLEKALEGKAKEKYPAPVKSLIDATKPKLLLSALKTADRETVNSLLEDEGIALQGICLVRLMDTLKVTTEALTQRGALVDFDGFIALVEQKLQDTPTSDMDNRLWLKHYQDSLEGILEDWRQHRLANQVVNNRLDDAVGDVLLEQWRTEASLAEVVKSWLEDQLAQSRSAYVDAWKKGALPAIEQEALLVLLTEALWRQTKAVEASQFTLLEPLTTMAEDLKLKDLHANQLDARLAKDLQAKLLERLAEGKRRKTLPAALDDTFKTIGNAIIQTEYNNDMLSLEPEELAALPKRVAAKVFEKWQANLLTDSAKQQFEAVLRNVMQEIQYKGDTLAQLRTRYEYQAIELLLKECLAGKQAPEIVEKVYAMAEDIVKGHLMQIASSSDKPLAKAKGAMEEAAVKALLKHWHQHLLPEAINDVLWTSSALEPYKQLVIRLSEYLAQDKEKRLQAQLDQRRFRLWGKSALRSASEPSVGSSSNMAKATLTPY